MLGEALLKNSMSAVFFWLGAMITLGIVLYLEIQHRRSFKKESKGLEDDDQYG